MKPKWLSLATFAVVSALCANFALADCSDTVLRENHEVVISIDRDYDSTAPQNSVATLLINVTPLQVSDDTPYSFAISIIGEDDSAVQVARISPFPAPVQGETSDVELLLDQNSLPENPVQVLVGLEPVLDGGRLGETAISIGSASLTPRE